MKEKKFKVKTFVADFETTTNDETHSEVWSAASIDLAEPCDPSNVLVFTNIDDYMNYLFGLNDDALVYFHNLKFDGSFILSWLEENRNYTLMGNDKELYSFKGNKGKEMMRCMEHQYKYLVSDMGQWYSIQVVHNTSIIEFRDSLKLLPFPLKAIGKNFKTKYQKLEMDYSNHTAKNQPITAEEMAYIKNDVLVAHEAMNIMYDRKFTKATIGSCCLSEFKKPYGKGLYREVFPDMTKCECPIDGFDNADAYIRKSYKGGWCYLKKGCEDKIYRRGITCDVNSLYPSMMQSESGNEYPVGYPTWFTGNIPDKAKDKYYFVRFRCFFDLKKGYLPTVQIKGHTMYVSNEWLETSRVKGSRYYFDEDGNYSELKPELTMTCTDFELFQKHYNIEDLEILDGCYFEKMKGLFDNYIDHWSQVKINATNPVDRQIAKLMLNNLYGKFASSDDSNYKIFNYDEGLLRSHVVEAHDKQSGYIPIGSAITSYARRFTITAAQENYYSFVYADTDSIHCHDVEADDIKGAPRHDTAFNHWKYEASWDEAIFVRQKTYIEHVVAENLKPIDEPYYNLKCAGMGNEPREIFIKQLEDGVSKLTDFKKGLVIGGNLKAKIVNGGTVLVEKDYKMR